MDDRERPGLHNELLLVQVYPNHLEEQPLKITYYVTHLPRIEMITSYALVAPLEIMHLPLVVQYAPLCMYICRS